MNVVVTGGGTIASIDDVRYITNTSTGRFSARITEACLNRGAQVWHVHAPTAALPYQREARMDFLADPAEEFQRLATLRKRWRSHKDRLHLRPLAIGNASDYASTLRQVFESQPIDVAFLAMAVSDFEPEQPYTGKIHSGEGPPTLPLRTTPKIIRSVKDWAPDVWLVGFKLLSGVAESELIRRAEEACVKTRADATVANDYQTVRAGRHRIILVRPGHPAEPLGQEPEDDIADRLVERVFTLARERMATRNPIALIPLE